MKRYIVMFLVIVLLYGGLSSVRELTELAIVTTIGIDMDEDGNYSMTAIVADTSSESSNNPGIIYSSKGKSVQEAARNIVDISPKKLYLGHLEVLIVSEDIARDNLENTSDFFIRDNEGSNSSYLFVAKGYEAKEIVEKINSDGINVIASLKSNQKYKGNANLKTLNDNFKDIISQGKETCVNCVSIDNDNITIADMAYFRDWNMLGYMSTQESIMYNMLINQTDNFLISMGENDDLIVAEVISSNTNWNFDHKNQSVNIEVTADVNITQEGSNVVLGTEKKIEKVENELSKLIINRTYEMYNKEKDEYKTDILNIASLLYRKKSELSSNEDYLNLINLNVDAKVQILNQGGIRKQW